MNSYKGRVQRFCVVTLVEITHPQYWNTVWTAWRVRFWCRALKLTTHTINFFLCRTAPRALRVAITGKFFYSKKRDIIYLQRLMFTKHWNEYCLSGKGVKLNNKLISSIDRAVAMNNKWRQSLCRILKDVSWAQPAINLLNGIIRLPNIY